MPVTGPSSEIRLEGRKDAGCGTEEAPEGTGAQRKDRRFRKQGKRLSSSLTSLTPKMPAPAAVVEAWPRIRYPIKAGILTMVKALNV
jgi:hypothetical protein